MQIKNLTQFETFLKAHIPTRQALFVGDLGLKRAKYFLRLLGNPQNKIKVIHLAGTSGKGSTAHLTSHLLQSQGFKVGLSISPHLFDIRERLQINNQMLPEKLVLKYFQQVLPTISQMEKCKYGAPTYFEILIGLAFHIFTQEKVDYAVIETGLGGRLDGTNVVTTKNKICLLTKIGLDHTQILGSTISKIASEKAGIIGKQNTTINIQQSNTIQKIIKRKCQEKNAPLYLVKPQKNYRLISATQTETIFDFAFTDSELELKNIQLNLLGAHQVENCALALTCLALLSKRDKFLLDEKKLRTAMRNITLTGRMEIRKVAKGKTLILDGAHNPQKMTAFTSALKTIFPGQKFDFIVAFKKGKDFQKMLMQILPLANHLFLTNFSTSNQDDHWSSVDNLAIEKFLQQKKFQNFSIIANEQKAVLSAIKNSSHPVVITGSLYLLSSVYGYLKK
ncbi:MAG: Mur ligase family protein [Candidatus Moraniibacteriota bacterium]